MSWINVFIADQLYYNTWKTGNLEKKNIICSDFFFFYWKIQLAKYTMLNFKGNLYVVSFFFQIKSLLLAFIWHIETFGCFSKICNGSLLANGASGAFYFHENCFLLGTIAKCHLHGSDLLVQQHFRWVQLRWDGEPMCGLLQKFLRRKVINKVSRTGISFSDFVLHQVWNMYSGNVKSWSDNWIVSGKKPNQSENTFIYRNICNICKCCAWL